eukprot:Blabericola_migrator_1__5180@NODE_2670_length_2479_cov_42_354892_g1671_i1_p1_GENE_NODE_2670_length_2479_cov_42_354892_g1671_i1NODE_2670_length_2479_cov_42_354892_g1671_i1_p1_ORF_typecomplete_len493_score59_74DUF3631/PF12307_8/1_1e03DUF3631/PF12307_8/9_3e02DUF3631/PF12307_8/13DUF3631/PF12307_8/1_1e03DUF3631/PF12307_8/3e02DUF932/PF06067_11/4_3e03DUF932/PF06067_11/0_081_NODE_2670_length_2479_cov_42_354892_g1671_i1391517
MSARHLQRPKQINPKDATVCTALLVTLAFDQPTLQPLSEESHVPSPSYTGPQSDSTERVVFICINSPNLLNSVELLRHDPSSLTSQPMQQRSSLKVNCLLQIIQARYVEKKGIPLVPKRLGELYTSAELIDYKDSDLLNESPQGHPDDESFLVATVDKLMKKLGELDKADWTTYRLQHKLYEKYSGTHEHLHEYFHAAQWLFVMASPEFFDENQNEFAALSTLFEDWANKCLEETDEKMPGGWSLLRDELTTWDFKSNMLKRCDAYAEHQHHLKVSKALSLLTSAEILDNDRLARLEPLRQWISLRINCLLQIAQASLVEKSNTPLKPKALGELYTPAELINCIRAGNVHFTDQRPQAYTRFMNKLMGSSKKVLMRLSEQDKARWRAYKDKHKLERDFKATHGHAHKFFHVTQWLFANASQEFFDEHRDDFVKLSQNLEDWIRRFSGKTGKMQVPSECSPITDVIKGCGFTSKASDFDIQIKKHYYSRYPRT